MATIVLRSTKGSALTFAEGDANFTNLNTDKIESVSEDTAPVLGGNLDLSGFNITDTTGNPKLGGYEYPKLVTASGTVTDVDAVRNPNAITLSGATAAGVVYNSRIRFTGTDVTAAGLAENTDYYIAASIGGDQFEISNTSNGSPISITDPGTITNFNWTAPDVGTAPSNGDIIAWNGTRFVIQAPAAGGLQNISEDTTPQLGGNLDTNGSFITNAAGNLTLQASSGNSIILDGDTTVNGFELSNVNLVDYKETVYSLGTTSGTITPDVQNGNVQSITLNGNLTLNALANPEAGQSLTLIINTNGTGRTLSSTMKFAGGVKTLSTTSTIDIISIFYDGTNYWASLSTDFK